MRKKPRVLAISTYFPIPQDQGDPIRVMMMLRVLEKIADLTVNVVSRPDTDEAHIAQFSASLPRSEINVFSVDEGPRAHRIMRAVRAPFNAVPPWVLAQSSSIMAQYLSADRTRYDLVVLIGEAAGRFAKYTNGPIVWDKANVLAGSLRANISEFDSRKEKLKALVSLPLARQFETRVLSKVSSVWVTSEADAARLLREYGVHADRVIASSVDLEQFNGRKVVLDRSSRELFWMSSFRYPPNWDGLVRLLRALADLKSEAVVRVAGYGASEAQIGYMLGHPNVNYVGFVEDPVDAAYGVRGAVVPLWAGAGVKLKTLTLAAIGLPLFATPEALEGLPPETAFHCFDSAAELADGLGIEMPLLGVIDAHLSAVHRTLRERFSEAAFEREVRRAVLGDDGA